MTRDIDSCFTFITVNNFSELDEGIMTDLLNEKITGILFKKFLSQNETESLLKGLSNIAQEDKTLVNEGFQSYPLSFAQFTQKKKSGEMVTEDYVKEAKLLQNRLLNDFGVDITSKLCYFLQQFSEFRKVSPILNTEFNSYLIPFNFRELFPGKGELIAHCENLFFNEFPEFFNWLKLMNIKTNKLSYFITLQEADLGGELCCYDINWSNVKIRKTQTILADEFNNELDIDNNENIKRCYIKPEQGDLLLFAGGNVWHRVEKVQGKKSRITLGGFIAETTTQNHFYIWS